MHLGKKILSHGSFWSALSTIYADLESTFRYIHPVSDHLHVYSLRYYELLLRTATEFESVCKTEIINNRLSRKNIKDLNIEDFFKLEEHFKSLPIEGPKKQLANWKVGYFFDPILYRQPLLPWKTTHILPWYRAYNEVKHNRQLNYKKANLENVLDAIASLFLILMNLDYAWTSSDWLGEKIWKSDGTVIYFDQSWPVCAKIKTEDLTGHTYPAEFRKQLAEQERQEPWRNEY